MKHIFVEYFVVYVFAIYCKKWELFGICKVNLKLGLHGDWRLAQVCGNPKVGSESVLKNRTDV